MYEILEGVEGQVCHMDDILVHGESQEAHDRNLAAVLDRLRQAGVTLNKKKCVEGKPSVKFLGHIVEASGIRPDPEKIAAVHRMEEPRNVSELRQFLGMTNQLAKFCPGMADETAQLRVLLKKENHWYWGEEQRRAFQNLRALLHSDLVLARYHPDKETKVAADASFFGLGAGFFRRTTESFDQSPSHHAHSVRQNAATPRSKRRHWPSPGHVSDSTSIC